MGMWYKLQPSATSVTGSPLPLLRDIISETVCLCESNGFKCEHRESNSYLGSGKRSNEVHGCACQTFTSLPHFSICSSALTPSELREGLCSPGCLRTQREKGTVNRNSCLRTKSRREGKGHELELSEGHR